MLPGSQCVWWGGVQSRTRGCQSIFNQKFSFTLRLRQQTLNWLVKTKLIHCLICRGHDSVRVHVYSDRDRLGLWQLMCHKQRQTTKLIHYLICRGHDSVRVHVYNDWDRLGLWRLMCHKHRHCTMSVFATHQSLKPWIMSGFVTRTHQSPKPWITSGFVTHQSPKPKAIPVVISMSSNPIMASTN